LSILSDAKAVSGWKKGDKFRVVRPAPGEREDVVGWVGTFDCATSFAPDTDFFSQERDPSGERQWTFERVEKIDVVRFDGPSAVLDITNGTMTVGVKYDSGKTRWDLVPWEQFREVAEVLTLGAVKYAPDNWKQVEHPRERYFSAAMRHLVAWQEGEAKDPETGKSHLAHAVCCLLFLAAREEER
jgi:hypothetical protein